MLLKYWYDSTSDTTWVSFDGVSQSWPNFVDRKEIHEKFDQVVIEILKDEEGRRHFCPVEGSSEEFPQSVECTDGGGDSIQE